MISFYVSSVFVVRASLLFANSASLVAVMIFIIYGSCMVMLTVRIVSFRMAAPVLSLNFTYFLFLGVRLVFLLTVVLTGDNLRRSYPYSDVYIYVNLTSNWLSKISVFSFLAPCALLYVTGHSYFASKIRLLLSVTFHLYYKPHRLQAYFVFCV